MMGVKEMRMNQGSPGSIGKIDDSNLKSNPLKEAINLRRKSKVAKVKMLNDATKPLGLNESQVNPIDTNFIESDQ